MIRIIIQNNKFGDTVRIGLYDNNKWLKWIKKKELDNYIDKVDSVENIII